MNARAEKAVALAPASEVTPRVDLVDWARISQDLDDRGSATIGGLLTAAECESVAMLYAVDQMFRSRVVMARHGFGRGEYKYFAYPLPSIVGSLRAALYPRLAPVANRWHAAMGMDVQFPEQHADFLERCHAAGQRRPTPLLLQYGLDDYNCLHQDLYGEIAFPLQAACVLSRHGSDYTGGEFLLTEQRPRMQTRGEAVTIGRGEFIIFANRWRPVAGTRGDYRVNMRHGVSRLNSGERYALGLIFHNAK